MIIRAILLISFAVLPTLPAAEPRWYKGNTHTHSLWSDGNDFPEMISDWYRSQGYDFLAMSDHNTLARGEKWVKETTIEKKKITLGPRVLDKYRGRFGEEWVETRRTDDGKNEVRLKTLEEYRKKLEEPGKFLLIEAEEISAAMGKVPVHINAINLTEVIPPVKDLATVREVMRTNLQLLAQQASKTGKPMIAHINHPNFQWALTAEDLAHVIEDRYFEVYNGHPKTFPEGDPARASSSTEKIWDVANTIRVAELNVPLLMGVATDDSHHYHGGEATSGRGWVMVRSPALEADALIAAMQAGDFYASTGVVLEEVSFDKTARKLRLKIKAEPGVSYTTEFRGTLRNYDRAVKEVPAPAGDRVGLRLEYSPDVGKILATSTSTAPEYALTGEELFVRATITSTKPHRNPVTPDQVEKAWTQPVR